MIGYYLMPHPLKLIKEIGNGKEEKLKKTKKAFMDIYEEIQENEVETIIIISPHGTIFKGGVSIVKEDKIEGDFEKFGYSDYKMAFDIDLELVNKIIDKSKMEDIAVVPLNKENEEMYNTKVFLDYGAMIPLYYLNNKEKYKIVHITYGFMDYKKLYEFGKILSNIVKDSNKKVAFIASGDLSHRLSEDGPYLYSSSGKKFDDKVVSFLEKGDLNGLFQIDEELVIESGQCALNSIYIMAGAMDGLDVKGQVLSYEYPYGIGHATIRFDFTKGDSIYEKVLQTDAVIEDEEYGIQGNVYTRLARKSIEHFLKHEKLMKVGKDSEKELLDKSKGVIVTLTIDGKNRGSMGSIKPTTSCIGSEIIKSALFCAFENPNFLDLTKEELNKVKIIVDIIEDVKDANIEDLDHNKFGVIVIKNYKVAVVPPNAPEVLNTPEQLKAALKKVNIYESEEYQLKIFTTTRFKE